MSDPSARDELTYLARALAAHVEWQRELGAVGLPRGEITSSMPVASPPVPSPSVRPPPPVVAAVAREEEAAPAPAFEVPSFLRKNRSPAPQANDAKPPVARPPVVADEPTPPTPAARPLFAEPARPAPELPDAMTSEPLQGEARVQALNVLADSIKTCTACRLHERRTQTVFARGNPFASLAFVGEGPGENEDLQGAPFVGAAGQLLDKIIGAMGMTEQDVYICNVVKCRPPNNRVPEPDEMNTCGPFLVSQLGFVRPQVIVALGKTASHYLLRSSDSMSKMRGRWFAWNGIPLLPTWHPSYLLRQPSAKKDTWEDMKLVLARLGREAPKR